MNDDIDSFVTKSWLTIRAKAFNFYLTPLYWCLGWRDARRLMGRQGHYLHHTVHCLCVYLEYQTLTKEGRAGIDYRRKIREENDAKMRDELARGATEGSKLTL